MKSYSPTAWSSMGLFSFKTEFFTKAQDMASTSDFSPTCQEVLCRAQMHGHSQQLCSPVSSHLSYVFGWLLLTHAYLSGFLVPRSWSALTFLLGLLATDPQAMTSTYQELMSYRSLFWSPVTQSWFRTREKMQRPKQPIIQAYIYPKE